MSFKPKELLRRVQFNLRRTNITLVGEAGKPWRRVLYILGGVLLAVLLMGALRVETQLMSTPEIRSIQERGVLRVGVRYDAQSYPGICGMEAELAQLLAARVLPSSDPANALELVEVTSVSAATKLSDGSVDVVIGLTSGSMSAQFSASEPYYRDPCFLVAETGTTGFVLNNCKLGAIQSNKLRKSAELLLLNAFLEAHPTLTDVTVLSFASYPDMLSALARQEVAAVAMSGVQLARYAAEYPIAKSTVQLGTVDYAVIGPSDSTAAVQLATLLLSELREDGSLDALYLEYGLQQPE